MHENTDNYYESFKKYQNRPLMILLGLYKDKYFNFVLSAIFYIIKHSPAWVLPIVTANIINCVTEGGDDVKRIIIYNAVVLSFLIVLNVPMNYLHVHFRSRPVRNVAAGLRSTLVHKIQTMTIPHHKEIQSGRLQSKIIRDVEAVETLSDQLFVSLLNILINITVALAITVSKSIVVFIFFLLMVPVSGFLVYGFKKPIKKHNQRFRKEMENTSARLSEMVQLVPVTRAHALEKEEVVKMDMHVRQIAEAGYGLDIIQANFGAFSWAFFQLVQVVCLVFTSFLAVRGSIQVGDVVMYQSYFTSVVGQISALLTLLPTISKGLESVSSIGEVILDEDVEDYSGKEELPDFSGNYVFDNVCYNYPNSKGNVLKDISFEVKEGEKVAFVGESGAGKTTIINMLIGFCKPTEGLLLIDGHNINDINLRSYRTRLAVVPQNTILFSGTIRDNIIYGTKNVSEETLQRVVDEAGLRRVINRLPDGLDTMVGENGDKLSGGQRQRISIARALIRDPKVIILDEATSALDAVSEMEVSTSLDHITSKCTTFMVAHRLETIKKADKIIVLKNGNIVETGSFEELMSKKGEFYRMEMAI